jgi:hypothetical protein
MLLSAHLEARKAQIAGALRRARADAARTQRLVIALEREQAENENMRRAALLKERREEEKRSQRRRAETHGIQPSAAAHSQSATEPGKDDNSPGVSSGKRRRRGKRGGKGRSKVERRKFEPPIMVEAREDAALRAAHLAAEKARRLARG